MSRDVGQLENRGAIDVSSSLTKYCDLVSDVAMSNARNVRDQFMHFIGSQSTNVDSAHVLIVLSFMNWTFAQGAWSGLSNTTMRRDLQVELKDALIVKLAREMTGGSSASDTAARAVALTDQFNDYLRQYNNRMQSTGDADSRTATLFAFERIQEELRIEDSVMNRIVPQLISGKGLSAEVEAVALEVTKAVAQQKKGFFSKLFGG